MRPTQKTLAKEPLHPKDGPRVGLSTGLQEETGVIAFRYSGKQSTGLEDLATSGLHQ